MLKPKRKSSYYSQCRCLNFHFSGLNGLNLTLKGRVKNFHNINFWPVMFWMIKQTSEKVKSAYLLWERKNIMKFLLMKLNRKGFDMWTCDHYQKRSKSLWSLRSKTNKLQRLNIYSKNLYLDSLFELKINFTSSAHLFPSFLPFSFFNVNKK